MAPKKQQQSSNGFYYFLLNFEKKHGGGLRHAAEEAGYHWQRLGPAQRKEFEAMALVDKGRSQHGQKYTTLGETYEQVNQETEEARVKLEMMEKTITDTLVNLGRNTGLKRAPFFFIHINHFCKKDDGDYIPAEIALTAYTILNGIEEVYHTAVNPGPLPSGYHYKAKLITDESHKMPLPPEAMGESDSAVIVENIMEFVALHGDGEGDCMPPFYTLPKNMESTEMILSKLALDYGLEKTYFRTFCLVKLFHGLKNFGLKATGERLFLHGVEDAGLVYSSQAEKILVNDEYCYSANIACKFHEDGDNNGLHCSRSFVTRWGWLLSNHLCANLDVKMIPGQHCPVGTVLGKAVANTADQNDTLPQTSDESWETVAPRNKVSHEKKETWKPAVVAGKADQRTWKTKKDVASPPLKIVYHGASAPPPVNSQPSQQASENVWRAPPSQAAMTSMAKEIAAINFTAAQGDFPEMKRKTRNQPGPFRQPPGPGSNQAKPQVRGRGRAI